MELTITLRRCDPTRGTDQDLLVTVPRDTPFSTLRAVLEQELGLPTSRPGPGPGPEGRRLLPHCTDVPLQDTHLFGCPPLLDGAVITWKTPHEAAPDRPPVVDLRVLSGPDAGRRAVLPYGDHLIGRSPDAALTLDDGTVSRRHATLRITPAGITVHNHGASNGVRLDDTLLDGDCAPVGMSDILQLGASGITVVPLRDTPPVAGRACGDGTIRFHPAPRDIIQPPPHTVSLPAAPAELEQPRLSMLLLLLPAVFSAAAAFLLNSPALLLFGLLGPALSLTQQLTDRRHRRRREAEEAERHLARSEQIRRNIAVLLAEETSVRALSCPDLATVAEVCRTRDHRLWARRPQDHDWIHLRVGRGSMPSTLTVRHGERTESPALTDVPITIDVADVTGIAPDTSGAESRRIADGLARSLLIQTATWHSPRALRLWVIGEDRACLTGWEWLSRLPHLRDESDPANTRILLATDRDGLRRGLNPLLSELQTRRGTPSARPRTEAGPDQLVVLLGGHRLREHADLSALLREGPDHGVAVLHLATDHRELFAECTTTVRVGHRPGTGDHARLRTPTGTQTVRPDLCPQEVAEEIARALAPLRDATPSTGGELPDSVRITELTEMPFDPREITRQWAVTPASTEIVVGRDAEGAVRLDLCADGPHVLIGGTTGSGKSELLRTLVAELARGNRPDRLAFVLIDYKGGSAFDACARLPHVVGLVTDLDESQTRRALTGLDAELRRRESALRAAGASDLEEYHRMVDAGRHGKDGRPLTHIARLVVVVDEFRSLADELPDFVSGLVRLAALGRSLGLHLVLATQRPAGIVSADMRANISLRIALRVRDPHDSLDLVETDAAARISPRHPGRAVIRGADQEATVVQTTYLGSRPGREEIPVEVRRLPTLGRGPCADAPRLIHSARPLHSSQVADRPEEEGSPDLHRLVTALVESCALTGARPPAPPWLPPLPVELTSKEIEELTVRSHGLFDGLGDPPAGKVLVPAQCAGPLRPTVVVDDPSGHGRSAASWHPGQGHLAVVGGPRSGRSTTVTSLVLAAVQASCPTDLAVYVVDASGALASLRRQPHIGAYLRLDEIGAVRRLIDLFHELACRSEPSTQRRLLVIDTWEDLRDALDRVDHGVGSESLVQAVRAGSVAGITVLAAGGRGLLSGPVSSVLTRRMILPLADPTEAYLAGVEPVPGRQIPGRVRFSWNENAGQVALPDVHGHGTDDTQPEREMSHRHCSGPQIRVRALPPQIEERDLSTTPAVDVDGLSVEVPFAIDHDGSVAGLVLDGRGVLVAGPRGSGRTNVLELIAGRLHAAGVPHVRCHPRGGFSTGDGQVFGPEDAETLLARLQEETRTICLVDDVDQVDGRFEEVLAAYAAAGHTGSVVAAGSFSELVDSYRGLVGRLRRSSYGVVLNPGPRCGDLYGTGVSVHEPLVPGRAVVMDDGRSRVVQVFRASRAARIVPPAPLRQSAATPTASNG
ncbi:FtsK/SpoIIIE domain-containing protein [Austwickia chelonae]|uniref:FHA domain-containing protein n=1 Tax=Austwickia chelonae NBRC 105200 TaxID=1184607 RepID=K6VNP7_9MICO|nr:FtsK/SpoIIIE domain-containing protein [Austwickia chelonae]GAB78369.1 hypothetical protein AUCHE_08_06170 [Austwickia chelonae NBRC 105200]